MHVDAGSLEHEDECFGELKARVLGVKEVRRLEGDHQVSRIFPQVDVETALAVRTLVHCSQSRIRVCWVMLGQFIEYR